MPSAISQNIGVAAAKVAQSATGQSPQQATGQASYTNPAQAAQASQVAAQEGSVKIELSDRKTIQQDARAEGTFEDSEAEERESDVTDDKVKKKSESAGQNVPQRKVPLDLKV